MILNTRLFGVLVLRAALTMAAALSFLSAEATRSAKADEIVIRIERIEALDRDDWLSRPDFLARVTIAGEMFTTPVIFNRSVITPNWVVRKIVPPGSHEVKLEILDRDLTKNDFVDINRVDNKRDLDFTVNTRTCRISGFSNSYRCGSSIVREGQERKKAAVSFRVTASR